MPSRTLLAAAILSLASTQPSRAELVYTVDRLDDEPSASTCSAAPNDCSLRGAVLAANSDGDDTVVLLPHGTYSLSVPGAGEDQALTGDLDLTEGHGFTLMSTTGALPTIEQTVGDRLFDLQLGAGVTALVGPLTLRGGQATGSAGGAIHSFHPGDLSLQEVTLTDNHADLAGGAIYYFSTTQMGQRLSLDRVVATGNTAGTDGGAVFALTDQGIVNVLESRFENNTAGSAGGGLYVSGDQVTTMTRSLVRGNTAESDNLANTAAGGGIYATGGELRLDRTGVVANTAGTMTTDDTEGAGVWIGTATSVAAKLVCENSTISENVSIGTGNLRGLGLRASSLTDVELLHTTIAANTGSGSGQAIYALGAPGFPTTLQLEASIIDGGCSGTNADTTHTSLGANVERPSTGSSTMCNLVQPDDVVTTGSLGLSAVGNHGGPTPTQALLAGSPAIDLVSACHAPTLTVDQREALRPATDCDAGAYEAGAVPPPVEIFSDGFESGDTSAWSLTSP